MPLVVRIQGLCVCWDDNANALMKVLMLNSAGQDGSLQVPFHLQTLAIPAGAVKAWTVPPLPSLVGRHKVMFNTGFLGWDLTGCEVTISPSDGTTPAQPSTQSSNPAGYHPDPTTPDWSDLKWVLHAKSWLPGAVLKKEAKTPGALTTATVSFSGGELKGGSPDNGADSDWVWFFSHESTQAVTDTLEWHAPTGEVSVEVTRGGKRLGEITLKDADSVAFLINEASVRDNQREIELDTLRREPVAAGNPDKKPLARHVEVYWQAFQGGAPTRQPVGVYRFKGKDTYEGTFCIVMRA